MLAVRPDLQRIVLWNRTRSRAEHFRDWAAHELGCAVEIAGSVADALQDADIVCSTTATKEPLVDAGHLRAGAHVNAVGASFRDHREFTSAAVARTSIFVDSRRSALAESGDIGVAIESGAIGEAEILAELGEVLLGRHPGRRKPEEVTFFKSLGLAAQDVDLGLSIGRAAEQVGVGSVVLFG